MRISPMMVAPRFGNTAPAAPQISAETRQRFDDELNMLAGVSDADFASGVAQQQKVIAGLQALRDEVIPKLIQGLTQAIGINPQQAKDLLADPVKKEAALPDFAAADADMTAVETLFKTNPDLAAASDPIFRLQMAASGTHSFI